MGMLASSLSMFVLTWGFVTDWPDLPGDRCNTRVWDSNTSYMCSALFHLMHHFPQVNLNCHFPSHLSCYWSFIAVQRGISLLIMSFFCFARWLMGLGKRFIRPFEVLYKASRRRQQQTQAGQPLGLAADNMCNKWGSEIQCNPETNAFSKAKQHSRKNSCY